MFNFIAELNLQVKMIDCLSFTLRGFIRCQKEGLKIISMGS